MKKKIAALLAVITMFSAVSSVFAAEYAVSGSVNIKTYNKAFDDYLKVQSEHVHSGSGALALIKKEGSNTNVEIQTDQFPTGATVSFWAKNYTSWRHQFYMTWVSNARTPDGPFFVANDGTESTWTGDNVQRDLKVQEYYEYQQKAANGEGTFYPENMPARIVETAGGGWVKWETNPWYTRNLSFIRFNIQNDQHNNPLYIDDIVVKAPDGSIFNIVDFEDIPAGDLIGDGNVAYGISVNTVGSTANLSWRNPRKDNIEAVNVYMDDVLVEGLESVVTTSGALNACEIQYATSDKTTFTVGVVIDGVEYKASATGKKEDAYLKSGATQENEALVDWNIGVSGTKPLGSVHYDYANKLEGSRSLRINLNTYVYSGEAGRNIKLITNDTYPAGTYSLTYRTKLATKDGMANIQWNTVTQKITTTTDEPITFIFKCNETATTFWIDDLRLYAYGADGNVIEENLFKNGSFENTPPADVYTWSFTGYSADTVDKITQVEGETYFASLYVTNNNQENGIDAYLITVIRKNGNITSINISDAVTHIALGETKELSSTIEVDNWDSFDTEANDYEVSVFAWNGLDSMIPLTAPAVLTD